MTKEEWITKAADKLQSYGLSSIEYAEGLYQTYVADDGDHWANDPEGAVIEDASYWEE